MNKHVLMVRSATITARPLQWSRLVLWMAIAFCLNLFLIGQLNAQRNLNLYHMNVVQSYQVNPAFVPEAKLYIGIPFLSSPNVSLTNQGMSFRDLGFGKPLLSNAGRVDYTQALLNADELNNIGGDASIEILNVGYRSGNQFFSVTLSDHFESDIQFPNSILALASDYQNELLTFGKFYDLTGFEVDLNHYRALALGYAREFGDRLSFGFKFKILGGLSNIRTTNNALGFVVRSEGQQANFVNNMDILTSGMDVWAGNENMGIWRDGNYGFAFDFGGRLQVNDKLEISASAVNLGFLKWNHFLSRADISNVAVDTSNINTFFDDYIEGQTDQLKNGTTNGIPAYFSHPAANLYAGANYQINDKHGIGLVLNTRFYKSRANVGAALSYSLALLDWLDFALSYAAYNNNYVNIGTGISVNKGPLQIYLASDNIVGVFSPRTTKNAHVNFGVNLLIGRDEASGAQDEPIAGTDEDGEEDAIQPMDLDDEEKVPSVFTDDPTDKVDARSFFVKAQVRDAGTGQVIEGGVYIDVYKTPVNGGRELVYTTRFPSGSFELELMKSDDMHEMKIESYGFEPTLLHFYATGTNLDKEVSLEKVVAAPPAVSNATPPASNVQDELTSSTSPDAADLDQPQEDTTVEDTVEETAGESFSLTDATSFRKEATSRSGVILRFKVGAEVTVLEKTNKYWWKVSYEGQEGYVKRALLSPN